MMEIKEQTALTALRDELRKVFEPFGARVEQYELHLGRRLLKWRARTPDYPSHHVGGAFEEWNNSGRYNRQHQMVIAIVREEGLLEAGNEAEHHELFQGRWVPDRLSVAKITQLLTTFGIALDDPLITVVPASAMWQSRPEPR